MVDSYLVILTTKTISIFDTKIQLQNNTNNEIQSLISTFHFNMFYSIHQQFGIHIYYSANVSYIYSRISRNQSFPQHQTRLTDNGLLILSFHCLISTSTFSI